MSSSSLRPVNEALECELSASTSSTNTLSESDFLVKYGHIDEIIPVKLSFKNSSHTENSVSRQIKSK
jgi:hypothetical protein